MFQCTFALVPTVEARAAPPTQQSHDVTFGDSATASAPGDFTLHGHRYHEVPLDAQELTSLSQARPAGEDALSTGLLVVEDEDLNAIQRDGSVTQQVVHHAADAVAGPSLTPATAATTTAGRPEEAAVPPSIPLPMERLAKVEFCVASPAVREVWPHWPAAHDGSGLFANQLEWGDLLPTAASPRAGDRGRPFLHVYTLGGSGRGAVASHEMLEALAEALMRTLRHQLHRLLRVTNVLDVTSAAQGLQPHALVGTGEEECEDAAATTMRRVGQSEVEVLRRCCRMAPGENALTVFWEAALLQVVTRSLAFAHDRTQPPRPASSVRAETDIEEDADMHRDSDGMEMWSDAVDTQSASSGSETSDRADCPLNESDTEGRAVWFSRRAEEREARRRRRQRATEEDAPTPQSREDANHPESHDSSSSVINASPTEDEEGTERPLSPPPEQVVAPLTLRHVPVSSTALSLRWASTLSRALEQQPTSPSANEEDEAMALSAAPPPSAARLRGDDTLRIRLLLESVAVLSQSEADTVMATELADTLLQQYLLPAEKHSLQGTSAVQSLSHLSGSAEEVLVLQEALEEYTEAAALAQRGVVYPFFSAPRAARLTAGWGTASTVSAAAWADRQQDAIVSRQRVYATMEEAAIRTAHHHLHDSRLSRCDGEADPSTFPALVTGDETAREKAAAACVGFSRHLITPMRVPGEEYYSETLMRVHCRDGAAASQASAAAAEVPSLAAAERATAWRCSSGTRVSLPMATELQKLMYALRRVLVTATANAALVATRLAGQAQHQGGGETRSALERWEAYAAPCDKASDIALSLLRWHEPYPTPLNLYRRHCGGDGSGPDDVGDKAAGAKEVCWCLSMYCKLRLRGARLYALAGDLSLAERWHRELTDTLQRWCRHHERAHQRPHTKEDSVSPPALASAWTGASTSAEAMSCHVPQREWEAFVAEVRQSLKARPE